MCLGDLCLVGNLLRVFLLLGGFGDRGGRGGGDRGGSRGRGASRGAPRGGRGAARGGRGGAKGGSRTVIVRIPATVMIGGTSMLTICLL